MRYIFLALDGSEWRGEVRPSRCPLFQFDSPVFPSYTSHYSTYLNAKNTDLLMTTYDLRQTELAHCLIRIS